MPTPGSSARRRLTFIGLTVLLALVASEALLRLIVAVSPDAAIALGLDSGAENLPPVELADDHLGVRPNPDFPDHDAAGFRNAQVPDRAAVVALGDSQTYGAGVRRAEAWPQVLARLTGHDTYQMAFGGFGPAHSLALFDDALKLAPETVIHAFYLGNDLYDAYALVHLLGQLPELRVTDPDLLERVGRADREETIEAKVERHYAAMLGEPVPSAAEDRPDGLTGRLHLVRLVRAATARPDWNGTKAWFRGHPEWGAWPFDNGILRTIFTPDYRLSAIDLDDPRIEAGLRISLHAIRRMHAQADAHAIDFRVLVVPTKESVFSHGVTRPTVQAREEMRRLAGHEDEVRRRTIEMLEERGIPWIDGRAALIREIDRGRQPYPMSQDGHPNATGHRAIARAVSEALEPSPAESN